MIFFRCAVEKWYLAGPITRRSSVQIGPALPKYTPTHKLGATEEQTINPIRASERREISSTVPAAVPISKVSNAPNPDAGALSAQEAKTKSRKIV
jgi:hypothetical protein